MAENKTKQTKASVEKFIDSVTDNNIRKNCLTLVKLMKDVTEEEPKMWGKSIVGFGNYHYKYASGREGDFFLTGFSPRKQNLTIYILSGFKNYKALMKKLGKYKTSISCLYVKTLNDIDIKVLKKLVAESVRFMKKLHP
jgi:hypothetical protein